MCLRLMLLENTQEISNLVATFSQFPSARGKSSPTNPHRHQQIHIENLAAAGLQPGSASQRFWTCISAFLEQTSIGGRHAGLCKSSGRDSSHASLFTFCESHFFCDGKPYAGTGAVNDLDNCHTLAVVIRKLNRWIGKVY
jgi:hypothetical protein